MDHDSNMLKAFHLPGYEGNGDSSDDEEEDEDNCSPNYTTSATHMYDILPVEHHGCFAHALQLIINDGFNKAGQVGCVISKCSRIVSHLHKSTIATELLEGASNGKMLHVGTPN